MALYLNNSTEGFILRGLLEENEEKHRLDISKCAIQAKLLDAKERRTINFAIRKNKGWALPDLNRNSQTNHWLPSRISKSSSFLTGSYFQADCSLPETDMNSCTPQEGTSTKIDFRLDFVKHASNLIEKKTLQECTNTCQKEHHEPKKKSGILAMTDLEFAWFERAHMESNLLEIYSEPSLRFCIIPPTPSFAIIRIQVPEKGSDPEFKVESCMTRSYDHAPPSATSFDEKGQFKVSTMDTLSEDIWAFHNRVTQTDTTLNRKLHLRDLLYHMICPIFPMCGLYVVGSSLNGFGNNSSDMDLCLMITNQDLDQKKDAIVVLNLVFTSLNKVEWIAEQQLIFAKVPILRIKFQQPYADIIVDINVNNSVAIRNTHLLCYYSSFDWRVRPLVTIVKEWAKKKGINDANRSSFTSYSLVLMVIHYLQCGVAPRLLPSLQKLFEKRFNRNNDVRSLNVSLPLPPIDGWIYNNKITLGELLIGFLNYYANEFDYDHDAISIHDGERTDRASVAQLPRHGNQAVAGVGSWRSQWRCICIEEPFTNSNTAHSIYDEMVFDEIKQAFRESHDELNTSRDFGKWLANCKPITTSPPKGGAMVLCAPYEGSSDHLLAVRASQGKVSSSTLSTHTAASGRSSVTSGSSLVENDNERQGSPISQLLEKTQSSGRLANSGSSPSKSRVNQGNQDLSKRGSYQQPGSYRNNRTNKSGPKKNYQNYNQSRNATPTSNGSNC